LIAVCFHIATAAVRHWQQSEKNEKRKTMIGATPSTHFLLLLARSAIIISKGWNSSSSHYYY
jgi:hypothetical protein